MTAIEAYKSPHSRIFLEFDKVMHTFNDIDHIEVGNLLGYKIELNENETLYLMNRKRKGILMAQINNDLVYSITRLEWIKEYPLIILLEGNSTKIWIDLYRTPDVCSIIGKVGKNFIKGIYCKISRVKRSVIGEIDYTMPEGLSHSETRDPEYNYSIKEDKIRIEIPQHYKPWQPKDKQQHKDEPMA